MSLGQITADDSPMDINSNLQSMGRYGRYTRIGAVVCLVVACILLLVSLAMPTGSPASKLSYAAAMFRSA